MMADFEYFALVRRKIVCEYRDYIIIPGRDEKTGIIRVEQDQFSFSRHGNGALFFNLFQREIIDITSIEKYFIFSSENFHDFLRSRRVDVDDEAVKGILALLVELGKAERVSNLSYSHFR